MEVRSGQRLLSLSCL